VSSSPLHSESFEFAPTTREVVVVLGMHRSGTSLCMNVLQELGVRLDDDLIPGDANNEPGYFESRKITELNDEILRALGATWDTPLSLLLPEFWACDPRLLPAKAILRDLIIDKVLNARDLWGFKDPRTAILLPLYEEVFADCGVRSRYILCIRDPRAVSRSLEKRNDFPRLFSEVLWLEYVMTPVQILGDRIRTIVSYEKWFTDAAGQAESLQRAVGLRGMDPPETVVEKVVHPDLNHAETESKTPYELASCGEVYDLLCDGNVDEALPRFRATWSGMRKVMAGAAVRMQAIEDKLPQERFDAEAPKETMQSSGRIMCQVFWRSEEIEFTEIASSSEFTEDGPGPRSVRVALPGGLGSTVELRLDPSDVPGIIQIRGLRIVDSENVSIWEWNGASASLAAMQRRDVAVFERVDEPGVYLFMPTNDPNLLLATGPIEKLSQPGGYLELDFVWCGSLVPIAALA
jgi:hypothetical protein